MMPGSPTHELSDDEAGKAGSGGRQARPGVSKKANKRAMGSKRVQEYTMPLPINFKEVAESGGFQEYMLPMLKRTYQRHEYIFDESHECGAVITRRPSPPALFADKYISYKAKGNAHDYPDANVTPPEKLTRLIGAALVRLSFGYFKNNDLTAPPTVEAVAHTNDSIVAVFGTSHSHVEPWTQKQVMAWAWPDIPLVGDALLHYTRAVRSRLSTATPRLSSRSCCSPRQAVRTRTPSSSARTCASTSRASHPFGVG